MIYKTQKVLKVPTYASTAITILKTNATSLNQSDRLYRTIVNESLINNFKIQRSPNTKKDRHRSSHCRSSKKRITRKKHVEFHV
jgi:hypothetical protein